jgi:DNA helicase HerA-like ATPase
MRLPDDSEHLLIVGKTGSGKTQAAVWHLSRRFERIPWIVIDYKGDPMIAQIPDMREISSASEIGPRGIHHITPAPDSDAETEQFLFDVWKRGNCGVFIDEAYLLPNGAAARALATQGRSKHIPLIVCTQRPVFINRFFLSEASFIQFFKVNDARDLKTVRGFMPEEIERSLPRFHSWYYDANGDEIAALRPVPDASEILQTFAPELPADAEPGLTPRLDSPALRYL